MKVEVKALRLLFTWNTALDGVDLPVAVLLLVGLFALASYVK